MRTPVTALAVLLAVAPLAGQESRPVSAPPPGGRPLHAPDPRPAIRFAILADAATDSPADRAVLRRAIDEINRIDPDFVMTIGDMILGMNPPAEWTRQAGDYRQILSALRAPWYPVAGNHDVYPEHGKPGDRTNERLYLEHFGPLVYSFDCGFLHIVVLNADEHLSWSDPPVDQTMSEAQLAWLRRDLETSGDRKVFVFLHHPRWEYRGRVWEPVHEILRASGRVAAVFSGHLHSYQFDGVRDGIEYHRLAVTGAETGTLENAGDLNHWNLVTARPDGHSVAVFRVGAVLPADHVTAAENAEAHRLQMLPWAAAESPGFPRDPSVTITLRNPLARKLPARVRFLAPDPAWTCDGAESGGGDVVLEPNGTARVRFTVRPARPGVTDIARGTLVLAPRFEATATYVLAAGGAQEVRRVVEVPLVAAIGPGDVAEAGSAADFAFDFDGRDGHLSLPDSDALDLAGPLTLEGWMRAEDLTGTRALISRLEHEAFGLSLAEEGMVRPAFELFTADGRWAGAVARPSALTVGRWVHVAGTFDGSIIALWIGGRRVASARVVGSVKAGRRPFYIGADTDVLGNPTSFFRGRIDEIRLSRTCRYADAFEPALRFAPDADTALLLHCDDVRMNLTPDASGSGHHATLHGGVAIVPAERP